MNRRWSIALLSSLAACSASGTTSPSEAPDEAVSSTAALPSPTALCMLRFGQSTVSDALAVLGPATENTTDPDGSGFLAYQYSDSPELTLLEFQFNSDQVLTGVTTLNIPRPACWSGSAHDAGL